MNNLLIINNKKDFLNYSLFNNLNENIFVLKIELNKKFYSYLLEKFFLLKSFYLNNIVIFEIEIDKNIVNNKEKLINFLIKINNLNNYVLINLKNKNLNLNIFNKFLENLYLEIIQKNNKKMTNIFIINFYIIYLLNKFKNFNNLKNFFNFYYKSIYNYLLLRNINIEKEYQYFLNLNKKDNNNE